MSVFEFVLLILVDVPTTLLLRRYLYTEARTAFRDTLACLHAFLVGGLYVTFLKDNETFFVVIDYGDNFYRDLIVLNVGAVSMIFFHAWSITIRHK